MKNNIIYFNNFKNLPKKNSTNTLLSWSGLKGYLKYFKILIKDGFEYKFNNFNIDKNLIKYCKPNIKEYLELLLNNNQNRNKQKIEIEYNNVRKQQIISNIFLQYLGINKISTIKGTSYHNDTIKKLCFYVFG